MGLFEDIVAAASREVDEWTRAEQVRVFWHGDPRAGSEVVRQSKPDLTNPEVSIRTERFTITAPTSDPQGSERTRDTH